MIRIALLHDALEDHPIELLETLTGEIIDDVAEARIRGRIALANSFNPRIARIVYKLTTPLLQPGEDKTEVYLGHTEEIVVDPEVEIIKLSDFIDNANGNHVTQQPKGRKLDIKYYNAYPIHTRALDDPNSLIPPKKRERIAQSLILGRGRMEQRLGQTVTALLNSGNLNVAS